MNDLAEQALRGLDRARKRIVKHPVVSLAVLGCALGATIVASGGPITAGTATTPLNSWFGLLSDHTNTVAAGVMFGAIVALLLLWLVAVAVLRTGACSERKAWLLVTAWAAPFAIGPPLLSADVYTYVGKGLLQRNGIDPYTQGPAVLGNHAIVAAMDPTWRSARSISGPFGTLIEHLAVAITGGHAFATVIVLRALGVLCLVAIGRLAAELAGVRRVPALALSALNPAVLLYVVSGAHLDGVMVALLLGALVAAADRRWVPAVVLVCAAAATKPIAIVAVPVVILMHCFRPGTRVSWRALVRDVAIAVGSLAAFSLIVPDGFGWRRNLGSLIREHTPFAIASIVSDVVRFVVPSASFDDLAIGGRIAVVTAAVCTVVYLLATTRRRPPERTIGYALLAAGLLGPVLYPWYLLWGVLCLAPTATGLRRLWVVALSCAACVLAPAGFGPRPTQVITLVSLIVVGLTLMAVLYRREQHSKLAARTDEATARADASGPIRRRFRVPQVARRRDTPRRRP